MASTQPHLSQPSLQDPAPMNAELIEAIHLPFAGCRPFDKSNTGMQKAHFVSGTHQPERLLIRYWVRESDQHIVGRVGFGRLAQGPPGFVHGGCLSAVLDEVMGIAGWIGAYPVLAAELNVQFRRSVPLHTCMEFHGWIEEVNGRKVHIRAVLVDERGDRYVDAKGLFMVLPESRIEEFKKRFLEAD